MAGAAVEPGRPWRKAKEEAMTLMMMVMMMMKMVTTTTMGAQNTECVWHDVFPCGLGRYPFITGYLVDLDDIHPF